MPCASSHRSMVRAAAFLACLSLLQCASDSGNQNGLQVPDLRPITHEQAAQFITYLRGVQTRASGGSPCTVAWAMINTACEERALLIQYAAALSSFPLSSAPPVIEEEDITEDAVAGLVENPGIDTATINIAGPLIMEYAYLGPDGSPVPGEPQHIHWPYHKGVVVNVEGELMVIDLSAGDEPLPIDEWAHRLVEEEVQCFPMSEDEYADVRIYWNSVMASYELPERPARICGYTITPMFRFRWDQDAQVDQLRWTPSILETQHDGFSNTLQELYGVTPGESDIPLYTCAYSPQGEEKLCEWLPDLPLCTP